MVIGQHKNIVFPVVGAAAGLQLLDCGSTSPRERLSARRRVPRRQPCHAVQSQVVLVQRRDLRGRRRRDVFGALVGPDAVVTRIVVWLLAAVVPRLGAGGQPRDTALSSVRQPRRSAAAAGASIRRYTFRAGEAGRFAADVQDDGLVRHYRDRAGLRLNPDRDARWPRAVAHDERDVERARNSRGCSCIDSSGARSASAAARKALSTSAARCRPRKRVRVFPSGRRSSVQAATGYASRAHYLWLGGGIQHFLEHDGGTARRFPLHHVRVRLSATAAARRGRQA